MESSSRMASGFICLPTRRKGVDREWIGRSRPSARRTRSGASTSAEQPFEERSSVRTLGAQARANDFQNFRLVFDREFLSTIVGRVDQNDAIFKKILDDEDFKQTLLEFYAARLYERLRGDDQLGLAPA